MNRLTAYAVMFADRLCILHPGKGGDPVRPGERVVKGHREDGATRGAMTPGGPAAAIGPGLSASGYPLAQMAVRP